MYTVILCSIKYWKLKIEIDVEQSNNPYMKNKPYSEVLVHHKSKLPWSTTRPIPDHEQCQIKIMIQASHTQVDYWRTICHQSRNTVDPEYFRLQSKVLQLINLDRITICHQAERWAVLKEQQNGERFFLHRRCTYTVFTVHCSLFSIQQQITSKCLTRSPGQRLVRFPNPLATGRQSWQLGNLTRQREGKTYSCGVVQITSVYACTGNCGH